MKKTADEKEVPSRCYYYLLECREVHKNLLYTMFKKDSLHELTEQEFWLYFEECTKLELKIPNLKKTNKK